MCILLLQEDFMMGVKKATVDFVLRDPNDTDLETVDIRTPHRAELPLLTKLWKTSYDAARQKIFRNLHTVNPLLAQILDLWHKNFRYFCFCFVLLI